MALWRLQTFGSIRSARAPVMAPEGLWMVWKHKDIAVCKKQFQSARSAEEKALKLTVSG